MFLVRAPNLFTLSGRPGLSYPDNAPILMFPKNDPNFGPLSNWIFRGPVDDMRASDYGTFTDDEPRARYDSINKNQNDRFDETLMTLRHACLSFRRMRVERFSGPAYALCPSPVRCSRVDDSRIDSTNLP